MEQYMNAAMAAIQKVIAAATPVAVKAYEISLLTLQIDAASQLIPALLIALVFPWIFWRIYKWDIQDKRSASEVRGLTTMFLGGSVAGIWIWQMCTLLQIWLWVKLFKPELWLVHQAIEKIASTVTK